MMSKPIDQPASRRQRVQRAFTLTELIVVLGIILVLGALLIPMVHRAWLQADRNRAKSDLGAVATALEAYRADFGDYPRDYDSWTSGKSYAVGDVVTANLPTTDPEPRTLFRCKTAHVAAAGTAPPGGAPWESAWINRDTVSPGPETPPVPPSSQLLARALLGVSTLAPEWSSSGAPGVNYSPGQLVKITTGATATYWRCTAQHVSLNNSERPGSSGSWLDVTTTLDAVDGQPGYGFKVRAGGRTYGPYLQPEQFAFFVNPKSTFASGYGGGGLFDRGGVPILYMPAGPSRNIGATDGYVARTTSAMYNAAGNVEAFKRPIELQWDRLSYRFADGDTSALRRMQLMAGDANANGQIDTGETPAVQSAYILWSAGPDRLFGPPGKIVGGGFTNPTMRFDTEEVAKCDDATNFR